MSIKLQYHIRSIPRVFLPLFISLQPPDAMNRNRGKADGPISKADLETPTHKQQGYDKIITILTGLP
jgi:hypothetical protein